ncbi:MAG: kinase/pyrophosphorylase, partial [Rhodospirillaceae bacterium]|nr:kinase/pyrophosphorylase [Rhodospirillaceae bacterium]
MNSRTFHLHLVSDATGETVITVARGAVAQFSDVEAIEHLWSLVRSEKQLKRVLSSVAANPGVVMFTLVDAEL